MDNTRNYAELPGELLYEMLNNVDSIARKASLLLNIDEDKIRSLADNLHQRGLIKSIGNEDRSLVSVIAVDGGSVFEKMTAADLLLAAAVGVEGIPIDDKKSWAGKNQYHAWSQMLSHEEYNIRLLQGIMHLMEMIILSESDYDLMIMDGPHITPIIKINSLLSAKEEGAGVEYSQALREFLSLKFNKIIPDIPDIFRRVFTDSRIVSITKYNSSKDFIEGVAYFEEETTLDDKAFFSLVLKENEYTTPQSFAQSAFEQERRWNDIHIDCNLNIEEAEDLSREFDKILQPISTKNGNKSSLYYLYFKPAGQLAYRLEIKKELAENQIELERMLYNLKKQIAFPFIIEPVPLYIADIMAKHVGIATQSIKEAIRHSKDFNISKDNFHLFHSPYRS